MVSEDAATKVLDYVKKHGQANTFKLARRLGIDRHEILDIIEELEEKQAIEFKHGMVRFLGFPEEEEENEVIREELEEIPPVEEAEIEEVKPLKHQKSPVRRRFLSVLKNTPRPLGRRFLTKAKAKEKKSKKKKNEASALDALQTENTKLKEKLLKQAECIENLEKTIEELKQKASVPTKKEKEEIEPKKSELPKFNITWMKNIKQLHVPKILKIVK